VSYHHGDRRRPGDQLWADQFSTLFSAIYEVMFDRSLKDPIGSDDLEYVNRTVREDYISGSSVTVLLCGSNTWRRKCVDWEIYSSLYLRHGLLGIVVPATPMQADGTIRVLDRFHDNLLAGYAQWLHWTTDPATLKSAIEAAYQSSQDREPVNWRMKMQRNL